MNRIFRRCGFAFLFCVSLNVGAIWASIQVKSKVGRLTYDSLELEERDGRLGLAKVDAGTWEASAPTITDPKGRFISVDPDGKDPTIHLAKEKGTHTNWAFEFTKRWSPNPTRQGQTTMFKGQSGFQFKMKVAEGPFKDWYVAVDPLSPEAQKDPEKAPKWRALKLVKDPKEAAEFLYEDTSYRVKSN
jgi:hypothetical protein